MVNFEDSTTISTPSYEVEKITILQRRYDLLESLEYYEKLMFSGGTSDSSKSLVRARLRTLFRQLKPVIRRKLTPTDFKAILHKLNSNEEADIYYCVDEVLDFIDKLKITRIDNAKDLDTSQFEEMNKSKGL